MGSFGIDETQYQNNMGCAWRIEVEASQVSNVYYFNEVFVKETHTPRSYRVLDKRTEEGSRDRGTS